ncbi:MAG: bifunctional 4-hydroxy-2-oxoglutarate aldolase/2-dehydro-3-deoxy-phosphogluconate aldolase [Deltaproteobacteria bacterium]|uniref:2-dehydro-3-deoxy-phosphogluconate aldolase n=1 Tax=Candidatus Zymogenus saltonus TaxID=2844893 RepID=A0A9D8KF44_9DELT|nr:bifunctional 4-hydroxy-2-oxoglutarate aldolase/2-dehydro-3-deoxy-phosphogluconate aldolase [Candidatus Zymogenus saltonus]
MNDAVDLIKKTRLVPVIKIGDEKNALPLARALSSGGLPLAEITFRSEAAEGAIMSISKLDDFLVGAGTVLSVETAKRAIRAGARFIVSPGLNDEVVKYCIKKGVPVFPGVMTPTEIGRATDLGLDILKFFPAEAAGGVRALKAVGAPFRGISLIPTGGINATNLADYLKLKNVVAVGGSWMAKGEDIDSGNFDEIERLTKEAVRIVRGLS